MKLIGLHGPMHCGKDTTFGFIADEAERRGLVAARRAFADKLKLSGMKLVDPSFTLDDPAMLEWANALKEGGTVSFTIPLDTFGRPGKTASYEIDGRVFWERLGTEAHRDEELFGHDCWVDALLPPAPRDVYEGYEQMRSEFASRSLQAKLGGQDITVITDVRFANEAERIKSFPDGEVWYVYRPDGDGHDDGHPSRIKLPDRLINRTINNNGTLEQLESVVQATLNDYIGAT